MRTVRPLDLMPYNKEEALIQLQETIGYNLILVNMANLFLRNFFKIIGCSKNLADKRRPHFSSMIVSGQMSRDEALKKLDESLYDSKELEEDIVYFCKKLRISRADFDEFTKGPAAITKIFPIGILGISY